MSATTCDLHLGDSVDVMSQMDANSVAAIVTDPPYGIGFMGKEWDHAVPGTEVWTAALRVAKPGAFMFAFGGTRLFHRMTCAIEDAGWEIRDVMGWLYGSGFPKSLNVSKSIDRMRHDREQVLVVTAWVRGARDAAGVTNAEIDAAFGTNGMAGHWTTKASQPAVPTLEQIPVLLAILRVAAPPENIGRLLIELNGRKGEPGANWEKREKIGEGSGVDTKKQAIACARTAQGLVGSTTTTFDITAPATELAEHFDGYGTALKPSYEPIVVAMKPLDGTFAQNAATHGVAGLNIDAGRIGVEPMRVAASDGTVKSANVSMAAANTGRVDLGVKLGRWPANVALDEDAAAMLGGPSRFFYSGKSTAKDREYVDKAGILRQSDHPTVKPVELMRWLVRMAKPPAGGVILDPFMGSGSTGVACFLEAALFTGIELSPEYYAIAEGRLRRENEKLGLFKFNDAASGIAMDHQSMSEKQS